MGSTSLSRPTSNKKQIINSIKPYSVHTKLNFNNISNIYNPSKKKEPKRRKTRKPSVDSNPPTPSPTKINKGESNGEAGGKMIRSRSVDPKSPER
jgi:hypothetical protein